MDQVIDTAILKDAEKFIHKTAYVLQNKNDVVLSYEELVQDGYLIFVQMVNWFNAKDESKEQKFNFHYFGKELWKVIKKKTSHDKVSVNMDFNTENLEDENVADLFYYLGIQHMVEMMPDTEREVIELMVSPSEELFEFAREKGMRPFPSLKLVAKYVGVPRCRAEKWVNNFRVNILPMCVSP